MKKSIFLLAGLAIMLFTSCSNEETTTRFVVRLTDSPGDYEIVNIHNKEIFKKTSQSFNQPPHVCI